MPSEDEVKSVKARHSSELLMRPGVSGVGVERDDSGQYVLAVHLASADPALWKQLPQQIDGVPVKFIHAGPYRKFSGS